jgi:hypothetical protein
MLLLRNLRQALSILRVQAAHVHVGQCVRDLPHFALCGLGNGRERWRYLVGCPGLPCITIPIGFGLRHGEMSLTLGGGREGVVWEGTVAFGSVFYRCAKIY